ncbi:GerW family sporulation protein [Clostridium neonatale]|uniref:GerW family sporulation protein n=1 Tax=Clostridium neonatale TaxID=137838 RepID=UPI001D80C23B|nr:spore germination protein GerW family protein [Clostridium neonatale]CAG9714171.1 Putative spore protein [Clostridium neonatale]
MENNFKESIDSIFSNFERFIKTETVVGQPIVVGEVTLVPIISVFFGCGAGGGKGSDNKSIDSDGAGGGGGARITTDAIVVIKKGEVSMLPIKSKNNLEALIEMVPEIITKVSMKKEKEEKNQNNKEDEE